MKNLKCSLAGSRPPFHNAMGSGYRRQLLLPCPNETRRRPRGGHGRLFSYAWHTRTAGGVADARGVRCLIRSFALGAELGHDACWNRFDFAPMFPSRPLWETGEIRPVSSWCSLS